MLARLVGKGIIRWDDRVTDHHAEFELHDGVGTFPRAKESPAVSEVGG